MRPPLHGLSHTPIYTSWNAMITRCLNKNAPNYKYYGGKGTGVCIRWRTFANFAADMGPRPEGMSLDRINSRGNYEPGNCRWADRKTQHRNTTRNRLLTVGEVTKPASEWAELSGISVGTIFNRLRRGWPHDEAISSEDHRKKTCRRQNR